MSSFALQVGDPTIGADSLLKPEDLFDSESLNAGIVPEQNPETTFTAVLESLSNSLGSLIRVRDQIKQTGKVSKSHALECVEAAPDIELAPLEYYTQTPSAQLGEPTVESISDYLKTGFKRLKEWLVKIWTAIVQGFSKAFEYIKAQRSVIKQTESVKALAALQFPSKLDQAQQDAAIRYIDLVLQSKSSIRALFTLNVEVKGGDRIRYYLSDFMSASPSFVGKILDVFESPELDHYLDYFKDERKLAALFDAQASDELQTLERSLSRLEESFEVATASKAQYAFNFSTEPVALLTELKRYTEHRIKESKRPRAAINELIDAIYQVDSLIKSNKLNVARVFDQVTANKDLEQAQSLQLEITNLVNQINKIMGFILKAQQEVFNYSNTLMMVDELVLNLVNVLNQTQGTNSMESLTLTQASYNLSLAMESIEASLEDANIALDNPAIRQTQGSASGKTSSKIIEWFKYVGKLIAKLIDRAVEWFDEATSNMVPRTLKLIMRTANLNYKASWKTLEDQNVSIAELNKAVESIFVNSGSDASDNLTHEFMTTKNQQIGYVLHDLTAGNFKVADTIIGFEKMLPEIEKTMRSLVEVSNKLKADSTDQDVIAQLAESVETRGFSEIYVGFMAQATAIGEATRANKRPAISTNAHEFLKDAKMLFRAYDGMQDRIAKIDKLTNRLAYILKDGKMNKLLRIMEKNVKGGLDSLTDRFSSTMNLETEDLPNLEPQMNAYRKLASGVKKSIQALRLILSLSNNYVLNVYLLVNRYNDVVSRATKFLTRAKATVSTKFSMQSLEGECETAADPLAEIERELVIESYMEQGNDSYQEQMSSGAASSGGASETSYLNQSGGAGHSSEEDGTGEGGFEEAVESLENSIGLFKKIQDAGRVDRYLALEAYEYDPTLLGNPKNYSNITPDTDEVPVALESLASDVSSKFIALWERVKETLNRISQYITKTILRLNNFVAKYSETKAVAEIEQLVRSENFEQLAVPENAVNEANRRLEAFGTDGSIAVIVDIIFNQDSSRLLRMLQKIDQLGRYESEFEKVGRMFLASDSGLKNAIKNIGTKDAVLSNNFVDMLAVLDDVTQSLQEITDEASSRHSDKVARVQTREHNYMKFRVKNSNKNLIESVAKRINMLAELLPAATNSNAINKQKWVSSILTQLSINLSKEDMEKITALPRLYNVFMRDVVSLIAMLQKVIRGIAILDTLALSATIKSE